MAGSEAAGDLVLIQTPLLFLCKYRLVNIISQQHNLHDKNIEVCINTRSPAASLPFIGWVTEETTVKWPILTKEIKGDILRGTRSIKCYDPN